MGEVLSFRFNNRCFRSLGRVPNRDEMLTFRSYFEMYILLFGSIVPTINAIIALAVISSTWLFVKINFHQSSFDHWNNEKFRTEKKEDNEIFFFLENKPLVVKSNFILQPLDRWNNEKFSVEGKDIFFRK